jgi:hypothetical protein
MVHLSTREAYEKYVRHVAGVLFTFSIGTAPALASDDPGPVNMQLREPASILQNDENSSDNKKLEGPPALRDAECQSKSCEGLPPTSTEVPAQPPKKKRQSRMQELQEVSESLFKHS